MSKKKKKKKRIRAETTNSRIRPTISDIGITSTLKHFQDVFEEKKGIKIMNKE